jgi:hypothetical protein
MESSQASAAYPGASPTPHNTTEAVPLGVGSQTPGNRQRHNDRDGLLGRKYNPPASTSRPARDGRQKPPRPMTRKRRKAEESVTTNKRACSSGGLSPPVQPRPSIRFNLVAVSRSIELSLQSSFQLSLAVLVRYRSRGSI